jgi:hypothetical protein
MQDVAVRNCSRAPTRVQHFLRPALFFFWTAPCSRMTMFEKFTLAWSCMLGLVLAISHGGGFMAWSADLCARVWVAYGRVVPSRSRYGADFIPEQQGLDFAADADDDSEVKRLSVQAVALLRSSLIAAFLCCGRSPRSVRFGWVCPSPACLAACRSTGTDTG